MFSYLRKKLGISYLTSSVEYGRVEVKDKLDSINSGMRAERQIFNNATAIRQIIEMQLAVIQHYCPAFEVIKLTNLTSDLIKARIPEGIVQEEVKSYYFPLGYFRYVDKKSNPFVGETSDDSDVEEVFEFNSNLGEELTQEEKDLLIATLEGLEVTERAEQKQGEDEEFTGITPVTNPGYTESAETVETTIDEHGFDVYGNYHDAEGRS